MAIVSGHIKGDHRVCLRIHISKK